jgi:hypothetical protein
MPQNWLFMGAYKKQREHLLRYTTWNTLARLGEHGFDSADAAGAFTLLLTLTNARPAENWILRGIDAGAPNTPEAKAATLIGDQILAVNQMGQLANPDMRVSLGELGGGMLLSAYADSCLGLGTGDFDKFGRNFWEFFGSVPFGWSYLQCSPIKAGDFEGLSHLVAWNDEEGRVRGMDKLHRDRKSPSTSPTGKKSPPNATPTACPNPIPTTRRSGYSTATRNRLPIRCKSPSPVCSATAGLRSRIPRWNSRTRRGPGSLAAKTSTA